MGGVDAPEGDVAVTGEGEGWRSGGGGRGRCLCRSPLLLLCVPLHLALDVVDHALQEAVELQLVRQPRALVLSEELLARAVVVQLHALAHVGLGAGKQAVRAERHDEVLAHALVGVVHGGACGGTRSGGQVAVLPHQLIQQRARRVHHDGGRMAAKKSAAAAGVIG